MHKYLKWDLRVITASFHIGVWLFSYISLVNDGIDGWYLGLVQHEISLVGESIDLSEVEVLLVLGEPKTHQYVEASRIFKEDYLKHDLENVAFMVRLKRWGALLGKAHSEIADTLRSQCIARFKKICLRPMWEWTMTPWRKDISIESSTSWRNPMT